jgi:type I restriction enzyme M protein
MGGRRSFFAGPLGPYRWRELMSQTLSAEERMTRFADGLELLGGGKKLRVPKKNPKRGEEPAEEVDVAAHLPALFRDIFRNAFLKFRDGRILTLFLTELSGFAYSHSEELGNAFEYILSVMGAQGDNGQFRMPRHVIDFMVACLDPQPGQTVLDPACGTGGFLVSAFRHILKNHTSPGSTLRGDRLTHTQRQKLYAAFTGYDINDQMVKLSRVNLFLHEFATPQIHIYDTLTNDARWPEKYDLILANPPFMTPKGGVVPHTRFRVPAKKSEVLFTDYIAEHLTPDGRAGVIVPNGIVATTQTAYVKLRRFLVEDSLVAVVSLPAGCFKPYSGVKTSILLLDKKLARTTDKILFLKIATDGFDLGDKRTPIEANDLPEAERLIRAWLTGKLGEDFASPLAWKLVAKSEVSENNDATLVAERFLGLTDTQDSDHPMVRLGDEELFKLESGGTPNTDTPEFWNGPHAWATLVDLPSEDFITKLTRTERTITDAGLAKSSAVLLPPESILVSTRATLGRVALAKIPVATNQGFKSIIIKDRTRALPEFVAIAVTQLRGKMLEFASGGTFKEISKSNFANLEIPLPPLEEQRRIVAEIEGYQQVIDGARQILAAYRVDIEPAADWPIVPLGEVLSFVGSGVTPKGGKSTYLTSGILFIRSQNVLWGSCDFSDAAFISDETHAEMARTAVKQWDVFLNITGASIGRSAIYTESRAANVNQHVAILRPNEQLQPMFLTRCLISSFMQEQIRRAQTGASREALNYQQIKELQIPLPPKPEQERIVAELDAEAAKVEAVRGPIPLYEAKIQRTLARVWSSTT